MISDNNSFFTKKSSDQTDHDLFTRRHILILSGIIAVSIFIIFGGIDYLANISLPSLPEIILPAPSLPSFPNSPNVKISDQQLIQNYPNLCDIDKALRLGTLSLDDVSENARGMIKQQRLGEPNSPC